MVLEFIAGCLGGCAGVLVGHPFDTIKVRLQTQCSLNPKYKGTWHCFSHTLKTESARGLYKGMSSPMAGVSVVNAIIFGVHGNITKRLSDPNSIKSQALAGSGAGFVQAFIASPMELVKTRMQIQSSSASNIIKSPLACLKHIFRTEGLKGVFRGQKITIMRELPGFATYFGSYEFLLNKMSTNGEASTLAILMAGGLAGTASWVLTYPLDVVKTRLQADGIDGKDKYKGMYHCLKNSVQTEGYSVLTRGLNSTIVRAFPTNAATFAVVSGVMRLAEETEHLAESDAFRDVIARGEILLSAAAVPLTSKMYPCILKHRHEIKHLAALCGVTHIHFLEFDKKEDNHEEHYYHVFDKFISDTRFLTH